MSIAESRAAIGARIAGQALLIFLIVMLPWFYGGVFMTARLVLTALLIVAFGLTLGTWKSTVNAWRGARVPLACMVGACLLGGWQLTEHAAALSPAATALRQEFAADPDRPSPAAALSVDAAATRRDMALLIAATAAFAAGAVFFWETKSFLRLMTALTVAGVAVAGYGISLRLGKAPWNYFGLPAPEGSVPFGPIIGRNNAGGLLNLCLAASIGVFLSRMLRIPPRRDSRRRSSLRWLIAHLDAPLLASGAAVILIFAGVVATLSRGSVLAAVVGGVAGLAMFSVASRSSVYFWLIGFGSAAALALIFWLGQAQALGQRWEQLLAHGLADDSRVQLWRESLEASQVYRFFGSGLGTFCFAHAPFELHHNWGFYRHAENQFVEALVTGGYLGLSLLAVLSWCCIRAARRLMRAAQSPDSLAVAAASIVMLLMQGTSAMFDFGWYLPALLVPLAVWCGALTRRAAGVKSSRRRRRTKPASAVPMAEATAIAAAGTAASATTMQHVAAAQSRAVDVEEAVRDGSREEKRSIVGKLAAVAFAVAVLVGLAWSIRETRSALVVERAQRGSQAIFIGPQAALPAQIDAAIEAQRAAVAACPDDGEARIRLAELLVRRYELAGGRDLGEVNRAASLAERIGDAATLERLRADPLADAYLRPALAEIRTARHDCPFDYFGQFLAARLCFLDEPPEHELWYLDRAERLAQGHHHWLYEVGLQHMNAARLDRVWAAWRRSWQLAPANTDAIMPSVLTYSDPMTALRSVVPDDPEVIIAVAQRYLSEDQYDAARREYLKKALDLLYLVRRRTTEQQYMRGVALSEIGDFAEAESSLAGALRAGDARPEWYWDLAVARAALGEREAARSAHERYQMLVNGALPAASYLLRAADLLLEQPQPSQTDLVRGGELYLAAGENPQALATFERAVGAKPGDAAAQEGLVRSLLRAGRAQEAVEIARPLVERESKRDDLKTLLAEAEAAAAEKGKGK